MENNIDLYGFYKRSNDQFIRWNNNNPATLRQIVSMKHEVQYMASDTITVEVDSVAKITDIEVGDYMRHGGNTFRLNQSPAITKTGERKLHYTYTFESVKYELINAMFILPANEVVTDDFTGTMFELLKMIVSNACRVFGAGTWLLPLDGNGNWQGTATLPTEAKTVSYDNQNCLYVLQNICEEWSKETNTFEYVITEDHNTGAKTIDIVVYEKNTHYIDNNGEPFRYGAGNGLYEIQRTAQNADNVITRLFCFGSSENLPTRYFATRLGLNFARTRNPNGKSTIAGYDYYTKGDKQYSYIEDNSTGGAIDRYGIREGVVTFDDVKPHQTWTVGNYSNATPGQQGTFTITIRQASTDPAMFDLNAQWQSYNADSGQDYAEYLRLRNMVDNPIVGTNYENYVVGTYKYKTTSNGTISFTSGDCAGMEFKISSYTHGTLGKVLVMETETDPNAYNPDTGQSGITYPTAAIHPKAGDTFVFIEIQLPWEYVAAAEYDLQQRAEAKLAEVSQPRAAYSVKIANDFVLETYGIHEADKFVCGKYLLVSDSDIGIINKKIRITQYRRDLIKGYEYELTISDFEPYRKTYKAVKGEQQAVSDTSQTISGGEECQGGKSLDMVFTCPDENTLTFTASDSTQNGAFMDFVEMIGTRTEGHRWWIENDQMTLTTNRKYYIMFRLPADSVMEQQNQTFVEISFVAPSQGTGTVIKPQGANEYKAYAGEVSEILYARAGSSVVPYRRVTMYIGTGETTIPVIGGGTIISPTSNITIDLDNDSVSFSQNSASSPNNAKLSFSATGGLQLTHAMAGTQQQSVLPCYRGEYTETETYNEGDEVIATAPSGTGKTTYRCIAETSNGEDPATSENWVAQADFESNTYSATQLYQQDGVWTYSDRGDYKQGTTRLYIDGLRKFAGIDYDETTDLHSIVIHNDVGEEQSVILEAVFNE